MPDMTPIPPSKISDLDFYGSLADGYVLAWDNSRKKWHPIVPPTGGGGGGGSVSSVGLSLPSIFSITNSPVTTSGTLAAIFATQSANVALGTGTSATSSPTFRKFDASIINSGLFGTNQIPNIFDQALNTINDVQFNNLKLTGSLTATNASATLLALNILSTGHLIVDGSTAFNGGLNVNGGLIADFINCNGSAITHISETNVLNLSTDLLARPTSITIIGSGVLHTTPNTGIVNNGTVSITIPLATQVATVALGTGISSGTTPSFTKFDAALINSGIFNLAQIPTNFGTNGLTAGSITATNAASSFGTQTISAGSFNAATSFTLNGTTITSWPIGGGGGTGSVTSVGLALPNIFAVTNSPITTSGTLTGTLATQTANLVLRSGTGGIPSFGNLVSADVPSLAYVTSVGLALPNIFAVTNSPITTSGTLTGTLATQTANLVLRSGTGGIPSFSSLVAADIPTLSSLYVTPSLTLSTTSPLTGGGNLSANRTFAINTATGTQSGALSSTDWTTFNNNVSTNRAVNTTLPLTGGGNLSADLTLAVNVFIASGTSHATGIVPDPGSNAGTTRFLCENATFLLPNGTDGNFTGTIRASNLIHTIGATFDGGGSAISGSNKSDREFAIAGIIQGWTVLSDQSGSVQIDVKKCAYANYPTGLTTIAGTNLITLSSAQKNQDNTITGWTNTVSAGDIFEFILNSATTITRAQVFLRIKVGS